MNRTFIIQNIINNLKTKTYLEIGVYDGTCFLKIKASRKIAVDPDFKIPKSLRKRKSRKVHYYEMTSDIFFEKNFEILKKKSVDVVFIDGLHTYQQSLNDVLNSLKVINNKGVIIMHDCNPISEVAATPARSITEVQNMNLPDWTGQWNGDVWKAIVHLRSLYRNLQIFVINCDYGLGIIKYGKPENELNFKEEEIKNLTYQDLEKQREYFLNLKAPNYFYQFLKTLN